LFLYHEHTTPIKIHKNCLKMRRESMLMHGKLDGKAGALAELGLDMDGSAMRFYNALADKEAQARAG
jgi:hypothetical protein